MEVARLADGRVGVRDSKSSAEFSFNFTLAEWRTFVGQVKRDRVAGE